MSYKVFRIWLGICNIVIFAAVFCLIAYNKFTDVDILSIILFFAMVAILNRVLIKRKIREENVLMFNSWSRPERTSADYVLFVLVGLMVIGLAGLMISALLKNDFEGLMKLIGMGIGPLLVNINNKFKCIYIENNRIEFPNVLKKGIDLALVTSYEKIHTGKIKIQFSDKEKTLIVPDNDTDKLMEILKQNTGQ